MTPGASWNERGLSPELYQAAREAASRAGMSVDEWLTTTFGRSAPADSPRPQSPTGSLGARLGELSQRFARSGEDVSGAASVRGARLADTVAKLNERLEQLTERASPVAAERAPPVAPPIAPQSAEFGIDQAIAEIKKMMLERQH